MVMALCAALFGMLATFWESQNQYTIVFGLMSFSAVMIYVVHSSAFLGNADWKRDRFLHLGVAILVALLAICIYVLDLISGW